MKFVASERLTHPKSAHFETGTAYWYVLPNNYIGTSSARNDDPSHVDQLRRERRWQNRLFPSVSQFLFSGDYVRNVQLVCAA